MSPLCHSCCFSTSIPAKSSFCFRWSPLRFSSLTHQLVGMMFFFDVVSVPSHQQEPPSCALLTLSACAAAALADIGWLDDDCCMQAEWVVCDGGPVCTPPQFCDQSECSSDMFPCWYCLVFCQLDCGYCTDCVLCQAGC